MSERLLVTIGLILTLPKLHLASSKKSEHLMYFATT